MFHDLSIDLGERRDQVEKILDLLDKTIIFCDSTESCSR